MNWIFHLLAQVPSPDAVVQGIQSYGPIYILVVAVIGLLGALAYLFRTLRAKEEQISALHERYGKELSAKDEMVAALHERYGGQIATIRDTCGREIAALEKANGQKIELMLSTWNKVTDSIERTLNKLVETMEKPTLKGP